MKYSATQRLRWQAIPRILLLATMWPMYSLSADRVNLEGTWRIEKPQTALLSERGKIPLTAKGKARFEQNKRYLANRDFDSFDYYTARCASPGIPRLMLTPDRFRIYQRPAVVTFVFEWNRLARQIDMGDELLRAPHSRDADDDAAGRATPVGSGEWQGDTLVVRSENFSTNTLVDNLLPHGVGLRVTERFRLASPDVLEDRITIQDDENFTKPWDAVIRYVRQPDALFPESVCLDKIFSERSPR